VQRAEDAAAAQQHGLAGDGGGGSGGAGRGWERRGLTLRGDVTTGRERTVPCYGKVRGSS